MKIALISDIHGNATALDAVLDQIRKEGVQTTLCLGDVIMFGPQPGRVLQRLRKLDIPTVMGNTDIYAVKWPNDRVEDERMRILTEIGYWCYEQLDTEQRNYVAAFQNRIEVEIEPGYLLLCCHGSPRSNNELILPTTPTSELRAMIEGTNAAIYAGGHTHEPMLRQLDDTFFINPGSVGRPKHTSFTGYSRVPYAEFAVIDINEGMPSFRFHRVQVAKEDLERAVRDSKMPNGQWWLEH
jgi:putative phosphoesterase